MDSHLKEFTAVVELCRPRDDRYEVVLDRTAFFPEGGGQYADTGRLGDVLVSDARERDGLIYHLTDGPLPVGAEVEGRIDWGTRFMKMQQHTGEHIVSGLVHARLGYNNVGFHLGSGDCTMDFDGEITREVLMEIEQAANEAAVSNLEVLVSYPAESELAGLEYRSKIEIEGQVRIVTIPGYDVCACCAPHVKRTGEIGMIKLTNVQRYKGGARVTMLCGYRALADYRTKEEQTRQISSLLCARENRVADAVVHLKEEHTQQKARLAQMQKILLKYKAQEIPKTEKFVCLFEEELEGDGPRILMNLILENGRAACVVFQKTGVESFRYVMGSRTVDMRPLAREFHGQFGGRGGGKPEMVQGSAQGSKDEMRAWMQKKGKEILNV